MISTDQQKISADNTKNKNYNHQPQRSTGSVQTHFLKMIYLKKMTLQNLSGLWLMLTAGITETVSRKNSFEGHESRRLQSPRVKVCGLIHVKEQAAP